MTESNQHSSATETKQPYDVGGEPPGADASTVRVQALMNSLPRWVLQTKGAFRSFLAVHPELPQACEYSAYTIFEELSKLADPSAIS